MILIHLSVRARVLLIKNCLMLVGLINVTIKKHEEIGAKGTDGNSSAVAFIALPEQMKLRFK